LKRSTVSIDNPETRRRSTESERRKERSTMMMKTDNHFKLCLEREKRKNTELKGVVGRVQAKNE